MDKFFKRLIANKGLVTIVAGIVCLAILGFAYSYRVSKQINPIDVPYATVDIPARTEITENMVDTIKVASSMVTSTVIRNKQNVIGKYANYNTYIPKGSLFYSSSIVTWDMMPDSTWASIADGKAIVSFPVSEKTTYGNSIFPGDKIDLYYQSYDKGKLVYGKFIEGIEILAVKDAQGNHIFKKGSEQQSASAFIFEVDEDLHLLLRQAAKVSGWNSLVPIPRNSSYNQTVNVSSQYIKNLIKSQVFEVPQDTIEEDVSGDEDITVNDNPAINGDINVVE